MRDGLANLVDVLHRRFPVGGFVCVDAGTGDKIREWPEGVARPDDATIEGWHDEYHAALRVKQTERAAVEGELVAFLSSWENLESDVRSADTVKKVQAVLLRIARAMRLQYSRGA